jgi:alkanesulfonate monooxygenase SsuD/methylene tetrahydromethanopterin reductase-like flavin-dependent oxidoreductase (luciferase family)
MHQRLGINPGKPLADTRAFVDKFRAHEGIGALPPIVLAALRKRMVALAGEIAQGVLFANASLSHTPGSLNVLPPAQRNDPNFLIGNMLPTCVTDDEAAGLALHRRHLVHYALLPNYRNYWKEAGYGEEMWAIEQAIAENRRDDIAHYLTDRWIADNTLCGSATKVRDRLSAWYAAGVNTPVLVPSSLNGNQITALQELFAAFAA